MRTTLLWAGLAVVCHSCSSGPLDNPAITKVKNSVLAQLRDPTSAEFSNVRIVGGLVVCGEVNAHNGFGGFAGKQKFYGNIQSDEPAHIENASRSSDVCDLYDQAEASVNAEEVAAKSSQKQSAPR